MRSRSLRAILAAAVTALAGLAASPAHASGPPPSWVTDFLGVNWSDAHSNYNTGKLVLTAFGGTEDYATVKARSTAILNGLHNDLGANTVRLPVNPATVNDPYWNVYKGSIDAATDLGMKVVLSYWEETPDGAHKGRIVNPAGFVAMWNRVTQDYANQPLVNFEPMNEPFGYADGKPNPPTCATTIVDDKTLGDANLCWADVAARWLALYPQINVSRIVISGTGYNNNVKAVGADHRLDGTLLSYHIYHFFPGCGVSNPANPDPQQVRQVYSHCTHTMSNQIGSDNEKRTIVDEFGDDMATFDSNGNPVAGPNYDVPGDSGTNPVGDPCSSDFRVNYLMAVTNFIHDKHLGAIYWPGLWEDSQGNTNAYALEKGYVVPPDNHIQLVITNQSGVDRLRYAWNIGHPVPLQAGLCQPSPK